VYIYPKLSMTEIFLIPRRLTETNLHCKAQEKSK
jgi:hypothetical protein